jgi:hypothetical protein
MNHDWFPECSIFPAPAAPLVPYRSIWIGIQHKWCCHTPGTRIIAGMTVLLSVEFSVVHLGRYGIAVHTAKAHIEINDQRLLHRKDVWQWLIDTNERDRRGPT